MWASILRRFSHGRNAALNRMQDVSPVTTERAPNAVSLQGQAGYSGSGSGEGMCTGNGVRSNRIMASATSSELSGQLEYRVRDATPHTGEIGICPLPREISRATRVAEVTPEHQPASLHWSDLHEPAEILPGEDRTVVSRGAQWNLRLITNPGSFNGSCGGRARRASHRRCS